MSDQPSAAFGLSARPANNPRYYILMAATVIGTLLVVFLNPATVGGGLNPLFAEGGFVEGLSPMGYAFCVVLIIAQGGFRFAFTRAFSLVALLLILMLRELDFQERFTGRSIEKLPFFTASTVPLYQKVIAFIVIALVAAVVLNLIIRHGRTFFAGLWKLDAVSLATALAIGEIMLSKSIDGIGNRLGSIGFVIGPEASHIFEKVEETAELGVALFAILAILAYFGSARDGIDAGL